MGNVVDDIRRAVRMLGNVKAERYHVHAGPEPYQAILDMCDRGTLGDSPLGVAGWLRGTAAVQLFEEPGMDVGWVMTNADDCSVCRERDDDA